MESPMSSTESTPRPEAPAKAISDLDSLVQALLSSVPESKPWQRQLRFHLSQADRLVQVLRLTIAMQRDKAEIAEAAEALMTAIRTAHVYVNGGRADIGTKAALQLGFGLAQTVRAALAT
jgi:hypothetical protein